MRVVVGDVAQVQSTGDFAGRFLFQQPACLGREGFREAIAVLLRVGEHGDGERALVDGRGVAIHQHGIGVGIGGGLLAEGACRPGHGGGQSGGTTDLQPFATIELSHGRVSQSYGVWASNDAGQAVIARTL